MKRHNATGRAIGLLAFALAILLLTCRCASHRPPVAVTTGLEPLAVGDSTGTKPPQVPSAPASPGSQAATEPGKTGWLARLLPVPTRRSAPSQLAYTGGKCKGCSFYTVTGGSLTTNTAGKNAVAGTGATGGGKSSAPVAGEGATLTNIEKPKAPVGLGAGNVTDQSRTGAASAIDGNGNAPVLTNTAPEAPGIEATIAGAIATPVGKVAGVLLLMSVGYGCYRLWPLLKRKKDEPTA